VAQSDDEEENFMKKNVFDKEEEGTLTHAQLEEFATAVFADIPKYGKFKDAFMAHAGTYGIGSNRANLELLFPDAHALDNEPGFDARRMGWVNAWMSQTRHTPLLVKLWADLTADAARAKVILLALRKLNRYSLFLSVSHPQQLFIKNRSWIGTILLISPISMWSHGCGVR
jgi:hypothetical protein